MGNQLSQQYEIKQPIAKVGPAGVWQVNAATARKTGQACTLFVWMKNDSGSNQSVGFLNPSMHDSVTWFNSTLTREVHQLQRLRYPNILKVADALVSTDSFLAFTTEPVVFNLHDVLVASSQATTSIQASVRERDGQLDDVDIQAGLIQIGKALDFLHGNQIVHLCILPECIFIDGKGDWKLSGFTYSRKLGVKGFVDSLPYTMPPLAYFAPEVLMDESENSVSILSDSYSFASLMYAIFNGSRSFTNAASIPLYIQECKNGLASNLANLPLSLQSKVSAMLSYDPSFRPDLKSLLGTADYFNNSLIGTLKTLTCLLEMSVVEKARFLKGLPTILQQFPFKTVVKKILPVLVEEVKNAEITVFVLPCLFWISERLSGTEFVGSILPGLEETVFVERDPPTALLLLLSRMDLLVSKIESESLFTSSIGKRLLAKCVSQSRNAQVWTAALKALVIAIPRLEKSFMDSCLLPHLIVLFQQCKSMPIQGNILICMRAFIAKLKAANTLHLEREMILKAIFTPLLDKLTAPPPELLLMVSAIYHECGMACFDSLLNSAKTLPALWRLSSHSLITKRQFQTIVSYIDEISAKVKKERMEVLADALEKEELDSVAKQKLSTPHSKEKLVPLPMVGMTPSSSPQRNPGPNASKSVTSAFFGKIEHGLANMTLSPQRDQIPFHPTGAGAGAGGNPAGTPGRSSISAAASKQQDWAEFDPL